MQIPRAPSPDLRGLVYAPDQQKAGRNGFSRGRRLIETTTPFFALKAPGKDVPARNTCFPTYRAAGGRSTCTACPVYRLQTREKATAMGATQVCAGKNDTDEPIRFTFFRAAVVSLRACPRQPCGLCACGQLWQVACDVGMVFRHVRVGHDAATRRVEDAAGRPMGNDDTTLWGAVPTS